MTVTDMRDHIIQRYSPVIRGQRVDRMPDRQVIAIYKSLIQRKEPVIRKWKVIHTREHVEQMAMDLTVDKGFRNDQTA